MANFIPLHYYSTYSLLRSSLSLEDYFSLLKKEGISVAGISDLDHFYGFPHFEKIAKKAKVKPLFGLTINYDDTRLVLYIKDETGYLNLLKITHENEKGTLNDEFLKHCKNGLILILPCKNGLNPFDEDENKARDVCKRFSLIFDDFYLGLERYEQIDDVSNIRDFATKYNYPLVAFPLIKYGKPEDAKNLEIINAIREGVNLHEDYAPQGPYFFRNRKELLLLYSQEEINLTEEISNKISFTLTKKRGELLEFPLPSGYDSKTYLRELALKGLEKHNLHEDEKYLKRLDYELNTIDKLGYNSYFLIVSDFVNYAINNNILVGPGRGSAAGSLVSYALGITRVDPIKYNLLFERFLNESRQTMPDIDIDFSDINRDLVVAYLREKYGHERVANIITFQTNGARQSIRDIGRVYDIEQEYINYVIRQLGGTQYSLRDSYRFVPRFKNLVDRDKYYLNLISLASKIEGVPRQTSLHAAGIILNNEPLYEVLPVNEKDNILTTQYEMGFLEDQGFLKMDLLGLTNLTTIQNCLTLIKKNYGLTLDYYNLPFDSKETYELISKNMTLGLFQLESRGMNNAIKLIKPSSLEDVVALISLYRPGPMENIKTYCDAKFNKSKISYPHPSLIPILEPTYGIIIYQEQIMQIVQVMANMDLKEADLFRRAISKKDEKIILDLKEKFIKGALNNGYSKKESENVFHQIEKFASYGFNRSHALCYAIITSQMAYLKANYPHEFYAACLLGVGSNTPKFKEYVKEIRKFDIPLLLPSVNKSEPYFEKDGNGLIFPLHLINGVSLRTENKILTERENGKFTTFANFISRMSIHDLSIEEYQALIESGAFDEFGYSRAALITQLSNLKNYIKLDLFSNEEMISRLHFPNIPDLPLQNIRYELRRLNYSPSGNPLSDYYKKYRAIEISNLKEGRVYTLGYLNNIREITTKNGDKMAFAELSDYFDTITLVIFPNTYEQVRYNLTPKSLYTVNGKFEYRNNERQIIVNEITKVEESYE
jgi:DNA polymerase-3 subunit alpha